MPFEFIKGEMEGIFLIRSTIFKDIRGHFRELFHQREFKELLSDIGFVQDNLSYSIRGVIRGLHYQLRYPQAKLVYVIKGEIFDVAVDIRRGSPTFLRWEGHLLRDSSTDGIFIPEGFAHGFCVISEYALIMYKCTGFYRPEDEYGISWKDPDLSIPWPVSDPILSEKDRYLPFLRDINEEELPIYRSFKNR